MKALSLVRKNLIACLRLLAAFQAKGLEHIVLCPGSRSGPLALALGELSKNNHLKLITSIDERSAAFLALGIATATGKATGVVTTSGSAVAHLLPAAVEADRSSQPILFLTADRPQRLKNCGSNQTVNQEDFLRSVCRTFVEGPVNGLHLLSLDGLNSLVDQSWTKAHQFPGPVHLNLSFEEPLHASSEEQEEVFKSWLKDSPKYVEDFSYGCFKRPKNSSKKTLPRLNPAIPGVVIVGPWRGSSKNLVSFQEALYNFQLHTGWPIFADPLSGVSFDQPGLIGNWELLISVGLPIPKDGIQVLRLGPIPASRSLENWLIESGKCQLLITEGDFRCLDPLHLSSQWSEGLVAWYKCLAKEGFLSQKFNNRKSLELMNSWTEKDQTVQNWLDHKLPIEGAISEPSLAHWLPQLLPSNIQIMLAASSPVRDWLSFSGRESLKNRCFGFRGASGIDGTLSLGMGLAEALGPTLLITGDLALLHDTNGWLFARSLQPPLVVLVIDNGGGGIFRQLDLQTTFSKDFEKLFGMPQDVDIFSLCEAYGIPYRQVACFEDLKSSLDWSFSKATPVLLRVCTDPVLDAHTRKEIRSLLCKHLLQAHQKFVKYEQIND